jgi:Protein of unknown function VcgC/VcgE (DUF2780)
VSLKLSAIAVVFALVLVNGVSYGQGSGAAIASPELVGALAKELGSTPQQAEGAAGSLFSLAKTKLKPEDWSKVAGAVPGMDGLLKAAPAVAANAGPSSSAADLSALAGSAGSLGGLATVASSFSKLGLKPEMVSKAIPVLTSFVGKSGGAGIGQLLAGALK